MSRTLLLADDSPTIQRVVELTFADEDVTVETVADGDRAIACIEAKPPDIVLADADMPGKNGYDVARHIKQAPHLSHIPVVLLTGAFDPRDQVRADAAGCDGVLAKPFEPAVVIATVRDLLERPRVGPVPVTGPPTARLSLAPEPPGDYFDRLDAAFADLSNRPAPTAAAPPAAAPPAATRRSDVLPTLADAFAALLEAEQREYGSDAPAAWPVSSAGAFDKEAFVDEVVQRVLARLAESSRAPKPGI